MSRHTHGRGNPDVVLARAGASLTLTHPAGLLSLSATLRRAGFSTRIYDLTAEPHKEAELLSLCRTSPPLWLGLTAVTPNVPAAGRLSARIRQAAPALPIVLGGTHASVLPEQTLREFPVDAVVVGEGEDIALRITEHLADGARFLWEIPHVMARDETGDVRGDPTPASLPDINAIAPLDWDAVDLSLYQSRPWQIITRGRRVATVFTSRGCPFHCAFCAVPGCPSQAFRKRDPDAVIDEIQRLVESHGVDEIHIGDDNFNADLGHAKAVLAGIVRRGLHIHWKPPAGIRLDRFDEEFLDLVVASGGYQVGFGIESGCEEVLRASGRHMDLARAPEILARYKSRGVSTFGFFILGLPSDTDETIERTMRFAADLPLDHVHVSLCVPYPGSKIYRELDARGLLHHRWEEYLHYQPFPITEIPPERLIHYLRAFYWRFYRRPDRAARLTAEVVRLGVRRFLPVAASYLHLPTRQTTA